MNAGIIRRVVIRGLVQGVGYRDWTQREAHARGIEGWVRNRRDGSVEAIFAGTEDAVTGMTASCRNGPRSASVDAIEEHAASVSDLDLRRPNERFSVLATA